MFVSIRLGPIGFIGLAVLCTCCDVGPSLPPFEKEVALAVSASWGSGDCVDVQVTTNLPEGSTVLLDAQRRVPLGKEGPRDAVIYFHSPLTVKVDGETITRKGIFCGVSTAGSDSIDVDDAGLLLEGRVAGPKTMSGGFTRIEAAEDQARLVGPRGELLKGPLTRRMKTPRGEFDGIAARTKTFVLEPKRK